MLDAVPRLAAAARRVPPVSATRSCWRPPSPTSSCTRATWATCPPRSTTCRSSTRRCRWSSSRSDRAWSSSPVASTCRWAASSAFCVAVTATTATGTGPAPFGWLLVVLAIGAAGGTLNGVIVARARVAPILATLATLSIFSGLALWVLPVPGGAIRPNGAAGPHQPDRADRTDLARARRRRLAGPAADPVRPAGVRHRQRRGQRDRRRGAGGAREGRCVRAVRPVQRAGGGLLRLHHDGGRRQRGGAVHSHVDRVRRRRRRVLQRWPGQRTGRDGRCGGADARHRCHLLRRHRAALPVALPGPVPGRGRAARHRRRPGRPCPEGIDDDRTGTVTAGPVRRPVAEHPAGAVRVGGGRGGDRRRLRVQPATSRPG